MIKIPLKIYEIPNNVEDLFLDVKNNDGYISYRIIDYNEGMDMDNIESLMYFLNCVGIDDKYVIEDLGTQVILKNPNYERVVIVNSGGLGDFFSHGFDCEWYE